MKAFAQKPLLLVENLLSISLFGFRGSLNLIDFEPLFQNDYPLFGSSAENIASGAVFNKRNQLSDHQLRDAADSCR